MMARPQAAASSQGRSVGWIVRTVVTMGVLHCFADLSRGPFLLNAQRGKVILMFSVLLCVFVSISPIAFPCGLVNGNEKLESEHTTICWPRPSTVWLLVVTVEEVKIFQNLDSNV